jgi:prolyl oligopeptidase PreP (S9A serine peptidase family)
MTDTYHGVDVTEDYRWLEDGSSKETITWTKAQQQRTRAYFDGIPWRDALRAAQRIQHSFNVGGGDLAEVAAVC